ncbi:Nn.00g025720.m01.CDS01 [Neocucurbitaria sp. VM-36]
MVLYHANGRVVIEHENYLEQQAHEQASDPDKAYIDQIECGKVPDTGVKDAVERVFIVVDKQEFQTLYSSDRDPGDVLPQFSNIESARFPTEGIDKATFMRYSTLADDVFRCEPSALEVRVPVTYPRRHIHSWSWKDFQEHNSDQPPLVPGKTYQKCYDHQMAYIRRDEIEAYIVPWLRRLEKVIPAKEKPDEQKNKLGSRKLPGIQQPPGLLEKIHLYNATLQFGLPKPVQRDVIDALDLQIYQTKLRDCHLETLEITIGRLYGRGVAVLDPVISRFIGTYAFRSVDDLKDPTSNTEVEDSPTSQREDVCAPTSLENERSRYKPPYKNLKRKFLEYSTENGNRQDYPNDTFIVPPELPVLGHCIKHWSGIRSNGSTAAAYTGYPLNVGESRWSTSEGTK